MINVIKQKSKYLDNEFSLNLVLLFPNLKAIQRMIIYRNLEIDLFFSRFLKKTLKMGPWPPTNARLCILSLLFFQTCCGFEAEGK